MKIYAGPCLLTSDQAAKDDCYKTAEALVAIDKDIRFRCKLWGGGTSPEKYINGICIDGIKILNDIKEKYEIKIGIEVRDSGLFIYEYCPEFTKLNHDFLWIAARASQNYDLLDEITLVKPEEVLIKRHPGMTIDEIIGIHDICEKRYSYKPIIVERGINTFCRTDKQRWLPDFSGMLRIIQERPDIELCFDPSHACGRKEHIFPMVKAADAIGVKNFMIEVMNDPGLSQTDQVQILNIEEFKKIYEYLRPHESVVIRNVACAKFYV